MHSTAQLGPVVIIPAYNPATTLAELTRQLACSSQIHAVVVVNDGSSGASECVFTALGEVPKVRVLRHAVNLGKGAALKTGMNYAACEFPDAAGVVTADADGQHLAEDVLRIAGILDSNPNQLLLGARSFGAASPWRSRIGNAVTCWILRAATGQNLGDTQTGLRGIPAAFLPELLSLRTNGYDFELDMIMTSMRRGRRIGQVPVATVYIDGNRGSHFNPLLDSMRIYFVFLRFAAVSLLTAALDNLVFLLAMPFAPNLLACQAAGRLVAGTCNYYANRRGVFHSRTRSLTAIPRYWLYVLLSGALSYTLIRGLVSLTGASVIAAKISAETALFFFSFAIQRSFVFPRNRKRR